MEIYNRSGRCAYKASCELPSRAQTPLCNQCSATRWRCGRTVRCCFPIGSIGGVAGQNPIPLRSLTWTTAKGGGPNQLRHRSKARSFPGRIRC
ncbi:hypothetical protein Pyn_30641 [Prunus yedoensis var. nudiflora]|uniref:Uncharacterized protein n=1 Tax=Prunus yedoensis var. nudiflora TaxID=2094558 RepID=A0A314YQN1_PRUYE|nr:hypothetical protein Pyn_30641 [Prunus yedoensis var. nudiflora]